VSRTRGRWAFEPARRWRGGHRELVWSGPHAPEPGDWIVAELRDDGLAHLVERLGADDDPRWDDTAVVSQFRLRTHFPRAAIEEAEASHPPHTREREGREDWCDAVVFTIDPEDARDHDDALSVHPIAHGRFEVGIHIADVSHYVRPDTALDREARRRGTSCYLPGGVVPMLPERLSADLCSLRPDEDRLAISAIARLDADGALQHYRFAETVIRSRARLAYGDVQRALDGRGPLPNGVQHGCETLMTLARGLRARRFAAGALALEVPEVKAWVDATGVPIRIERRPHLESHELIEEFMLLANRCVGQEGARRASGVLYRVHESPVGRKLAELDVMLKTLGLPRLGALDQPARALQALLAVRLDPPKRRLLHRLVLRSPARVISTATSGTSGWRPGNTATSPRRSGAIPICTTTAGCANGSAAVPTRRGIRTSSSVSPGSAAPPNRPRPTPNAKRSGSRAYVISRRDSGSALRVSSPV
jgi:ribonuclease R